MTHPGIEPTISRTPGKRSTTRPLCEVWNCVSQYLRNQVKKTVLYVTNLLFPTFKVIQRTPRGQTKIFFIKHLFVFVFLHMFMWLIVRNVRMFYYLCMSTISLHVSILHCSNRIGKYGCSAAPSSTQSK